MRSSIVTQASVPASFGRCDRLSSRLTTEVPMCPVRCSRTIGTTGLPQGMTDVSRDRQLHRENLKSLSSRHILDIAQPEPGSSITPPSISAPSRSNSSRHHILFVWERRCHRFVTIEMDDLPAVIHDSNGRPLQKHLSIRKTGIV